MAWKTTTVWIAGTVGAAVATITVINLVMSPSAPEGHYVSVPQSSVAGEPVATALAPQTVNAVVPDQKLQADTQTGTEPASQDALAWKGALATLGIQAENVEAEPGRLTFKGLSFTDKKGDRGGIERAVIEGLEPASMAALLGSYNGVVAQRLTFSGIVLKKEDGSHVDAGELILVRPYYQTAKSGKRVFRGDEIRLRQLKAVKGGAFAGAVEEIVIANAGIEFGGDGKGALLLSQDPARPPSIRIKNFSAPADHASGEEADLWREALGTDLVTGSMEVSYAPRRTDDPIRDLLVSINLADMADLDLKTSVAPRETSGEWLRLTGNQAKDREVPDVMFHGFSLEYRDNSLMGRILDYVGREQGKSGDEMAQEVSLMAAFLTMAAGNEGAAKLEPLTRSLSDFLHKPGRFSLAIEPIKPFALAELTGEDGISPDIIKRLRIKASAGE